MNETLKVFQLLSDETRMRILMLLTRKELCVCQLMGILSISQPLISRNLSLLDDAGLLMRRRDGKMLFYSVKKDLPVFEKNTIDLLKERLKKDEVFLHDIDSLADCTEYQKKTGKCNMKTFLAFMEEQRKKRAKVRTSVGG